MERETWRKMEREDWRKMEREDWRKMERETWRKMEREDWRKITERRNGQKSFHLDHHHDDPKVPRKQSLSRTECSSE